MPTTVICKHVGKFPSTNVSLQLVCNFVPETVGMAVYSQAKYFSKQRKLLYKKSFL